LESTHAERRTARRASRLKDLMQASAARIRRAFTLVELLVVIGIIGTIIGILLPALSKSRQASLRIQCLSNLRSMEMAQMLYASELHNLLIEPGDGSYAPQGSWIGMLEPYAGKPLVRRCPADNSPYFDSLDTDLSPAVYRLTSYGINNYVTPSHAPLGTTPPTRIAQIKHASSVIQFVELSETGSYAVADHIHVDDFYFSLLPGTTLTRICGQMPVGRHGGTPNGWDGVLNYGFLDGHAESLRLRDVYVNPTQNLFNPAVAQ
jgi:prepilin-type N-terminal cleavage/methylation domain-containing protein/prepilin-type processing-associated H-X9-DG protein